MYSVKYMSKIPQIVHYCWIGGVPLPALAEECIASWKKYMPNWTYMRWDETTFDIASAPLYVRQAYEAKKFAFVSDYMRLWALENFGGLYMDVDFEVFRSFDNLMDRYPAFAGYEGSKRQPVMMGVIASEPHGAWVRDMLSTYEGRTFILPDGRLDMTPNTSYFTDRLEAQGFVADGKEKDVFLSIDKKLEIGDCKLEKGTFLLHVFPVHYFCPVLTTGEDVRTAETYCEHKGESSWAENNSWKSKVLNMFGPKMRTRLIKLKRKLLW